MIAHQSDTGAMSFGGIHLRLRISGRVVRVVATGGTTFAFRLRFVGGRPETSLLTRGPSALEETTLPAAKDDQCQQQQRDQYGQQPKPPLKWEINPLMF